MFKAKKIIYISFCFLFVLTGCDAGSDNAEDADNWQNEVLLVQGCGMDGLSCCPDKVPTCQYGQECCTNPNNIKENMCADNCVCGEFNKFCCKDDPQCDAGLACSGDRCVPCGEKGQPCCMSGGVEDECEADLVCHKSKCVECGHPGAPCCEDGLPCLDQEAADSAHTECRNDVCVYCGTGNKVACEKGPACLKGYLLNNDKCWKCGEFNKPCCDTETGADYECDPEKGLECSLGFCAKK